MIDFAVGEPKHIVQKLDSRAPDKPPERQKKLSFMDYYYSLEPRQPVLVNRLYTGESGRKTGAN